MGHVLWLGPAGGWAGAKNKKAADQSLRSAQNGSGGCACVPTIGNRIVGEVTPLQLRCYK